MATTPAMVWQPQCHGRLGRGGTIDQVFRPKRVGGPPPKRVALLLLIRRWPSDYFSPSANFRQASALNAITGAPSGHAGSIVSRTNTWSGPSAPASTQLPLVPL